MSAGDALSNELATDGLALMRKPPSLDLTRAGINFGPQRLRLVGGGSSHQRTCLCPRVPCSAFASSWIGLVLFGFEPRQ